MKAIDLGSKKVLFTVFKLTLPAMLAQFISVLYSIVDRMYVGNIALIKKAEKIILSMCLVFTSVMFAISFPAARPFVSLFTADTQIAQKSVWGIRVFMIGTIPLSFQYAFVDGLTALGQPQYSIVLSFARKVVVYLGCTILLPVFFGVQSVFYAEPVCDIFSSLLSTAVFLIVFPKVLRKRLSAQKDLLPTDASAPSENT